MKDFSAEAFQILNTITTINAKYNQIEKTPREYADGIKVFPSQIRTLVMIGHHPGINLTELAEYLEITKASASEAIGKLVESGLVRKTKDVHNSKELLLYTTEKCRVVLQDIDTQHEKMFQEFKVILSELHEPDFQLVVRVLKKIESYLDEFIKRS
jgi:DNA-binding MarR family transcriptional regulator